MEYDLLNESNYYKITNYNYSWDYGNYIKENKLIFGLGFDLDLTEFKDSAKKLIHMHETALKSFLNIKKGDYIEWIMVERINIGENRFLKINQILGKIELDFYEGYEFIKNKGHLLPIRVIEESHYDREFTDFITFYEIRDINQFSKFTELKGFNELKNEEITKWYIKFDFFGLENTKFNENEIQIKFEYIISESMKKLILENMNLVQKDQYILGEFISKNNERTEVSRVIGKVKEINIDGELILTLDKISQENKKYEYPATIDIAVYEGNKLINLVNKKLRKNKNIIFYGPPGTGKTYNIANEILKIITPSVIMNKEIERYKLNNVIKKFQAEDRVKFCTFHQSYGYEEFIEGLRSDGNGNFIVEDGVLKEIAIEAMFEGLVYECKEDILKNKNHLSVEELKEKKKEEVMKYINKGSKFDFFNCPQYVIVIDEINRGNISRIFGELITLLEEDKRLGQENEMILKLPYSKEEFALPPNLHLIGTMNTSDKSIAPIDIALRRRFKFVEMMPKEDILPNIDGIDLYKMLKKLNDRIEYLYDRDHKIGHAYFINLSTLNEIIETFKNKIIPLLQEYFYEDFYKVGLILGGIGTSKDDKYIVYKKEGNPEDLFDGVIDGDFPIVEKYYIKYEIGFQEILNIYA
ncbi:AAA family ATPase [Bacillus sp. SI2]|uniref:McrB family protein n=1 Tax=Bacillus sp. SI2 TaxID=3077323 RepID=UPI0028E47B56|nr:AAA family ATPase [Bacillus sp. SI2]WNV17581.1 AAA family ATPase [Bacillus sp. SI2]